MALKFGFDSEEHLTQNFVANENWFLSFPEKQICRQNANKGQLVFS